MDNPFLSWRRCRTSWLKNCSYLKNLLGLIAKMSYILLTTRCWPRLSPPSIILRLVPAHGEVMHCSRGSRGGVHQEQFPVPLPSCFRPLPQLHAIHGWTEYRHLWKGGCPAFPGAQEIFLWMMRTSFHGRLLRLLGELQCFFHVVDDIEQRKQHRAFAFLGNFVPSRSMRRRYIF